MKILFQGDSITDTGRNTSNGSTISIGQGYAMLIDAALSERDPLQYEFMNYGISGNRIVDLYARIKKDCWNLAPDVISILLGINDVLHEPMHQNGVEATRFYNVYKMLVQDTLEPLPGVKFILMEPFVGHGTLTDDHWDYMYPETLLRAQAVCKIAEEFHLPFLPLQSVFDDAQKKAPVQYWLADGVHPTPAGHQLIAKEWIRLFDREILHK